MCGIVGKLCLNDSGDVSLDLIKQMTGALHHRGPDESGVYLDDLIGLGHARLSIVDLSSGIQPIHNENKTLWIVFNGEVFNYPELRQDLLKKGHQFYTSSDTEVILHLYEEMGPSCLEKLNGQFAIAIWDSQKEELFLARDRIGIRPLFYTVQENVLLFASEVKSIFMDRTVSRSLDPSALNNIFTFWSNLPGQTVFTGIRELPPGHYLLASGNKMSVKKYWEIPFYPPEEQLSWPAEKYCEKIHELLMDAIRIRLRADVPIGSYLSGGLDSSLISALVANNFNSEVKTFGIRFENQDFDEGKHQRLMVDFLGTQHTDLTVTNKMIGDALPDVLWHCETPLLRTGPVPLFLLSDVVNRNRFKVVLTGEGADEIFGGYNIFREAKVRNFWARNPCSKLRGRLIERLYPYIFKNSKYRAMQQSFFAASLENTSDPIYSHQLRWQNTGKIRTFLGPDFSVAANIEESFENIRQNLPSSFNQWDYLAKAQYLESKLFLSNYLLSSQGDRVAMAHSVEIRVPFLDYRIIDLMGRVPAHLKISGLNEKYLLKKAFQRSLPPEIIDRPKHPYRAPIAQSLLHSEAATYTQEMLSDHALKSSAIFDTPKVNKLLSKLRAGKHPSEVDSMALVGILSTQVIHDRFIAGFPYKTIQPASPTLIVDRKSAQKI